jgi:hypothetical protein
VPAQRDAAGGPQVRQPRRAVPGRVHASARPRLRQDAQPRARTPALLQLLQEVRARLRVNPHRTVAQSLSAAHHFVHLLT